MDTAPYAAPFRNEFDQARDPLTARTKLGAATNPVPTAQIADGAVTAVKLADSYALASDFPAGAWTTWTPTISSSSGTITSTSITTARYTRTGKTVTAFLDVTITNAGTGSGFLNITLPVTASAVGGGALFGREIGVTSILIGAVIMPSTTATSIVNYLGATIIATNYRAVVAMFYEGV